MSNHDSSTIRPVVIVLNWNGLADTLRCLESLEKLETPVFDIIIVDNASTEEHTDATLASYAKSSKQTVVLLKNNSNKGFAGGVNTGIRYALKHGYSHIALINNDATVEPSWLDELLRPSMNDDSIGITTCSLLHAATPTIDSTGEQYSIWGLPFPRLRNKPSSVLPGSGEVFGASGGASLYRREVFETIGLFDETFFAYYEDTDLSFRARLWGWKVYYTQAATAYHIQGATSAKLPGFTIKQAIRNLPQLFIKNMPTSLLLTTGPRFWFAYNLIALKAIIHTSPKVGLNGYLQGVWMFWTHAVPARFKIQRSRRVPSEDIKKLMWPQLPPDQTGLRKLFGKSVE